MITNKQLEELQKKLLDSKRFKTNRASKFKSKISYERESQIWKLRQEASVERQ